MRRLWAKIIGLATMAVLLLPEIVAQASGPKAAPLGSSWPTPASSPAGRPGGPTCITKAISISPC